MNLLIYFERQKRKYERFKNLLKSSRELIDEAKKVHDLNKLIELSQAYPDFLSAQKPSEIRKLLELASSSKVKTICEVGTSKGGSLFLLAQVASTNATLISVDIKYKDMRQIVYRGFAKGSQKIHCVRGNTHEPSIIKKIQRILGNRTIDLLFIDGDHSFFGVMNDFIRFSPLVTKGGIIVFHDVQPDSNMKYGIETQAKVGGVPIFWNAVKQSGLHCEEYIEDLDQDGYGLGIVINFDKLRNIEYENQQDAYLHLK